MPLRTRVENPQDCFKNATGRDGFASGTTIGNVLPENASGSVPIARPGVESSDIYSGSTPARNFGFYIAESQTDDPLARFRATTRTHQRVLRNELARTRSNQARIRTIEIIGDFSFILPKKTG